MQQYSGLIENLDLNDWKRVLDVNLTGPMLVSKHSVPYLRNSKFGGAIVNISSTRAKMSEKNSEAYAASKGGLESLTHAMAVSLGPSIRVNCIAPGWIETRSWKPQKYRELIRHSERDVNQHPTGCIGNPEDIAVVVDMLACNNFLTGQCITVDGGMTVKMIYEQ